MAQPSPVSDTQVLLQSMLQRLKLQTHAERGEIHTQEHASSLAKLDGESAESSTEAVMYKFGNSMDKQQQKSPSVWTNLDSPWRAQSSSRSHEGTSATPGWDYMNSHGPQGVISHIDNGETSRWERKQLKFSQRKASDGSSSITSINTTENASILPTPPSASPTLGWKAPEEHSGHSGVWTQGVGVGDTERDEISVTEQMTRTRTSRTSKRKWGDPVKKRWTQKVKERWRERHKKEGDGKQKQELTEEAKSNHCPAPTQPTENNTTAAFFEEEKIDQQISCEADEAPPSPLDHMSETLFSFGSFNLMEEIFSGMEWAKFYPSTTDRQLETACIPPDPSMSQTPHGGLTMGSQLDPEEATARMNSESYQQDMNIADDTFNQTKTSAFSLPFFQNFELFKDQSELFNLDSDQLQSMDLSASQSENDDQPKYQAHLPDMHQNYQSKTTTEASVHQSLSSEQNLNQSQLSGSSHTQPEFLPLLDLSYLKPTDSSSVQMHGPLSRKRGHCTLRRGSSDRGRPETGQVQDWRENAAIPLHPVRPVPSLSPSSSISSLQYSISQDSESSASTETVVKKRRLENTRRVRFAEEVLFLPPLILSEDDENDSVFDDDDYGDGGDDDDDDDEEAGEAGDDDDNCQGQPQSRHSIPNWILALRTKTKRRPKLKFPRKSSTPTKFKDMIQLK